MQLFVTGIQVDSSAENILFSKDGKIWQPKKCENLNGLGRVSQEVNKFLKGGLGMLKLNIFLVIKLFNWYVDKVYDNFVNNEKSNYINR